MAKSIYDEQDNVSLLIDDNDLGFNVEDLFKEENASKAVDVTDKVHQEIKSKEGTKKVPEAPEDILLSTDDDEPITATDDEEEEVETKSKPKDEVKVKEKGTTKSSKAAEVKTKGKTKGNDVDYKAVFNALKERNVLTVDIPDELETDEDVLKVFETEAIAYKQDYDSYMDSKYGGLLSYLENGGDINKWIKTQQEYNYDNMKWDDIKDNQVAKEKMYIDYFKAKGLDDDEILPNLKRLKDLEELDSEVEKKIYPKMANYSKAQKESLKNEEAKQAQQRQAQLQQMYSTISKTINESNELIPNMGLKKRDKEEIMKRAISPDVFKKIVDDPIKARILISTLDYYGVLDGKWDKILSNITTNTTKQIKSQFIKTNSKSTDDTRDGDDDEGDTISKLGKAWEKTFGRH